MYRRVFLGVASLACSLSSTSHAEMDEGCFQRMLGQRDERLQSFAGTSFKESIGISAKPPRNACTKET